MSKYLNHFFPPVFNCAVYLAHLTLSKYISTNFKLGRKLGITMRKSSPHLSFSKVIYLLHFQIRLRLRLRTMPRRMISVYIICNEIIDYNNLLFLSPSQERVAFLVSILHLHSRAFGEVANMCYMLYNRS